MVGPSCNVRSSRYWSWNTKQICRAFWLAVVGVAIVHGRVTAESRTAPVATNEPIVFDLPAQPLASAIEAYSVASGWQIIYDAGLAVDRRSAPVKGQFAPAAALRMLLAGTGLTPEYMTADGAMLIPDPAAVRREAPIDAAPHIRNYFGLIQSGLKREFCADEQIRSGGYKIAISFWVGSSGAVTRSVPLGSTGRAEIDAAFDRAVRRLSVGRSPPTDFDQPVVILVTPDLIGQCNAAGQRPLRAAR